MSKLSNHELVLNLIVVTQKINAMAPKIESEGTVELFNKLYQERVETIRQILERMGS